MAEGGYDIDGSEPVFEYECTHLAHSCRQEAVKSCKECKTLLCQVCLIHHDRNIKGHTLDNIESLSKSQKTNVGKKSTMLKCPNHPDRDIEMYCGSHDMAYCSLCVAKNHRPCKGIMEIQDVPHTSKMSTGIGKLEGSDIKKQRRSFTVNGVKSIDVNISGGGIPCINGICQLSDGTMLLTDIMNLKLKKLDDQLNVMDIYDLPTSTGGICSVSPTEVAVIGLYSKMIDLIQVGTSPSLQREICVDLPEDTEITGLAYCSNQFWILCGPAIHVFTQSGSLVRRIKHHAQGELLFPCTSPQCIAVSNDESLVFVTKWDNGFVVFNRYGAFIREIRDDRLRLSCGICITPDDLVLVSGAHCDVVLMFDRNGECLGQLSTDVKMLYLPFALGFDKKNCRLVVGSHNGNIIQCYDLS